MTDRKPLLLVQQFRHVTKARKTYLSEAQERSRTLGDILNRLGVDEEETSQGFLDQFSKLKHDATSGEQRNQALDQEIQGLHHDNSTLKDELRSVIHRRQEAEASHADLMVILEDVYQIIREDQTLDQTLTTTINNSFMEAEQHTANMHERRKSLREARRKSLFLADLVEEDDDQSRPGTPQTPGQHHHCCPESPQPRSRFNLITTASVPRDLSEPPSDAEEEPLDEDDVMFRLGRHDARPAHRAPVIQPDEASEYAPAASNTSGTMDETVEASTLEEGPEARPLQLKHLAPEHVEAEYQKRKSRRARVHQIVKHKCPSRRRQCDQCQHKIKRGHEHYRCNQCTNHFCESCERMGVAANCVPPPFWDSKAAKKRTPVPYGRNLENDVFQALQVNRNRLLIPHLLYACVKELDIRVPRIGNNAEGIFRKPGSDSAVQRLVLAYAEGQAPWLRDEDVDDIASTVKSYLRHLDEPLLTFQLYASFAELGRVAKHTQDDKAVQSQAVAVLAQLPPLHFFSLWYLMRLLHRLCRCETITKMGASQFGVCFGPTLLRAQQPQQEVMDVASGINAKVVEVLVKLPKRAWQSLHMEFLERSQLAEDISPVPSAKKK